MQRHHANELVANILVTELEHHCKLDLHYQNIYIPARYCNYSDPMESYSYEVGSR